MIKISTFVSKCINVPQTLAGEAHLVEARHCSSSSSSIQKATVTQQVKNFPAFM
jgi:hypothetical protein